MPLKAPALFLPGSTACARTVDRNAASRPVRRGCVIHHRVFNYVRYHTEVGTTNSGVSAMRSQLILVLALVGGPAFAQDPAENAFERAQAWTVYIKGSLETPFAHDEQGSWTGSGLVVDAARGWVLTNAHVASHSYAQLSVTFHNGKPLPVQRVYVDPYLDLAVLAYDPKALAALVPEPTLECDTVPATGHPVGAYGHPWGFKFTGTRGITSALTSRLGPDMLQTDAAINSGNSVGPLISLRSGNVVGVNTATAQRGKEKAAGIGFAVPMPFASHMLALLRDGLDPSPPDKLVHFAVDDGDERTLTVAHSRLPAGTLDLRPGDTITAADGRPVATQAELVDALRGHLADARVTVERGGQSVILTGHWPAAERITTRQGVKVGGALFSASDSVMSGFLEDSPALMIHYVEPGSDAESAELQAYDLLLSADGQPVESLAKLSQLVDRAHDKGTVLNLVLMRVDGKDELFTYHRRTLPATSVRLVRAAPAPEVRVAAATPQR